MNWNSDWRTMHSAPRDGSYVEIRCTYGIAPWYGLFRWTTDGLVFSSDGRKPFKLDNPEWVGLDGKGIMNEGSAFMWRPFTGDPSSYIDPTKKLGLWNRFVSWFK